MIHQTSVFPTPDLPALAHSQQLLALVRDEITRHGGISFARYMELALYAPGLGYYSAGAHKFGAAGDFVTAPEISPLFSRCIAKQCQQVLTELDQGDILELGAGSGTMAAEILAELEQQRCLPEHYYILEISADLRQRQQQLLQSQLPHLYKRVIWLDTLETLNLRGGSSPMKCWTHCPCINFTVNSGGIGRAFRHLAARPFSMAGPQTRKRGCGRCAAIRNRAG